MRILLRVLAGFIGLIFLLITFAYTLFSAGFDHSTFANPTWKEYGIGIALAAITVLFWYFALRPSRKQT